MSDLLKNNEDTEIKDLGNKNYNSNFNSSIAIQVLPKTESDVETVAIVDEVIKYIKSHGLKTHVGPFETTIEGDFDQLMEILKETRVVAERAGADKMMIYVKINYSKEGDILTIDEKTEKHK